MPDAGILEIVSGVGGIGGVIAVVVLYMGYSTLGRIVTAYHDHQGQLLSVVERNTEAITKNTATAEANMDVAKATKEAVDGLAHEVRCMKRDKPSPRSDEDLMVGLYRFMRERQGDPAEMDPETADKLERDEAALRRRYRYRAEEDDEP